LMKDTSHDLTEQTAKRVKMDIPDVEKPGNKDQFEHNASVLHLIEKAEASINKGEGEAGIALLDQGKKLVLNRQKLVRLADREEDGWLFVKAYTADKLADGPEDEKAMANARRVTAIKRKDLNRKKNKNKNFYSSASFSRRDQGPSQGSSRNYSQPQQNNRRDKTSGTDFRRDHYDRDCYICGRKGHLSYNCPDKYRY